MINKLKEIKFSSKLLYAYGIISIISLFIITFTIYFITLGFVKGKDKQELDQITKSAYEFVKISYDQKQQSILYNLSTAEGNMAGKTRLDEGRKIQYTIENQVTREKNTVNVPAMLVNNAVISKTADLVDYMIRITGGATAIYQIIPEGMLMISTSIRKNDGNRAVGIYIPKDSPVYQSIIQGKIYSGRAYVVDDWYITGYKPLYDMQKKLIGAVFVGVKQNIILNNVLKEKFLSLKVGRTGYAFILDTKGMAIIHPAKEGQSLWDSQDSDGTYIVREFVQRKDGWFTYNWLNKELGETKSRKKITRFMYMKEMDIIIGAGSYNDEFNESIRKLSNSTFLILFITLLIVSMMAYIMFVSINALRTMMKNLK